MKKKINLNHYKTSNSIILGTGSAFLFSLFFLFFGDLADCIGQSLIIVVFVLCHKNKKSVNVAVIANTLCMLALMGTEIKSFIYYLVAIVIPVYLLTQKSLQYKISDRKKYWYPDQLLIGNLGQYSLLLTILIFIYWHGVNDIATTFKILQSNLDTLPLEMHNQRVKLERYTSILLPYIPGIKGAWFIITMTISVAYTQKLIKNNKLPVNRPIILLSQLYLPTWVWKYFIGIAIMVISSSVINTTLSIFFSNLMLPLLALFALQGLAVIYAFAKQQKKRYILFVFLLIFMLGWPLLIVILLGLVEPWLQLRNRIRKDT